MHLSPTICILAAGVGSRLGDLTESIPKALLPVAGTSILERQLAVLAECGVPNESILIVTGYAAQAIDDVVKGRVRTLYNPKFKEWNNIYSVYILHEHVDDLILLNGDTLVHPDIMKAMLDSKAEAALTIDTVKDLAEEEMKTIYVDGRMQEIGKVLDPAKSHGEYIGLLRFRGAALKRWFAALGAAINEGRTSIWYEIPLNDIVDDVLIDMVSTEGRPWIEIDTPEDRDQAEALIAELA